MSDRYIYNSKKLVLVFISLCAITMLQLGYFIWIITNVQNDNFKLKIICIVYRMWSQRSTDKSPQLSFIGEYKCVSNYIWSKSDDQWSEKKIDKGSHRVKLFWGQGREPRTPLPPMASPSGRGTLSKLLSNATVKLLQKDWGEHYSRPSMVSPIPSKLQSYMQCSLEGYPHPITGMSPQMKIYHNCQKLSASYHNPGRSLKWKFKYVKK